MTTIAYKDGMIASDSAVSDDDLVYASVQKVFRTDDGFLGGAAGLLEDMTAFKRWILSGRKGKPPVFQYKSSEGLLVYPDGRVEWFGNSQLRCFIEAPFHALGSGKAIALGAMAAGATAFQAVEIACQFDLGTRQPIHQFFLDVAL